MSQSVTWFITGSSRGIGLEIVRQLSSYQSNIVLASCRTPSKASALQEVAASAKATVHLVTLDIADVKSVRAVPEAVGKILGDEGKLDYLVNNAAVSEGDDHAFSFSVEGLMTTLQANVAGPALLSQVLLPFVERSDRKVIANTTSGLASFGRDFGAKNASYSISKTALNMLVYKQAKEKPLLIVFAIDPGWVKTDMGGAGAMLEPQESVSKLLIFYTNARAEHSGGFFDYTGATVAW